jgi:histone H3/H4|tara:strand:+ start:866 stop:1123 length:258 start_codon:yes stop_codon:yes gene_type:complete
MELLTKPSINRMARKAGIKTLSEDCYDLIKQQINDIIDETVVTSLILADEQKTKTIMNEDLYKAIRLNGYNITHSYDLGTSTKSK